MTLARRGLLMSVALVTVALLAYTVFAVTGSAGAQAPRHSIVASRRAVVRATKNRVVGRAGTPTVHLRGFGDFDLGPARLGTGNRSHGNERKLMALPKVAGNPRRAYRSSSRSRSSTTAPADLGRLREVASLRTADSNTFQSASGEYVARIYTGAVNYRAANGRFEPINDGLRRAGRSLTNRADTDRVWLPVRLARPIAIKANRSVVRLRLLGASRSARASVAGNTARYARAYSGTTVSLRAVPGSLELAFKLASRHAERTFQIGVTVPRGLRARLRRHVLQLVGAHGRTRFEIPVPLMLTHVKGGFSPSYTGADHVQAGLSHRGGRLILTYTISRAWLNQQRSFPVVLDPQLTPSPTGFDDCTINSNDSVSVAGTADCSTNGGDDVVGAGVGESGVSGEGPTDTTYVTMLNFPASQIGIAADDQVLGANLKLSVDTLSGNPISFAVLPMSDSFTQQQGTWQYADLQTGEKWQCPGGDYEGCASGTPTTVAGTGQFTGSATSTTVAMTALAQAWVDGSQPGWESGGVKYLPVMLYPTSSGGNADIFRVGEGNQPTLTIYYTPRLGSDPGSTLPATGIDQNTSLGINIANGDVQLRKSDLNVSGTAGMDLALSHGYNGNTAGGGWTADLPPSLASYATDSEVLSSSDGNQSAWDAAPSSTWGEGGAYSPPPGVNGSLCEALPNGSPAAGVGEYSNPYVFYVGTTGQLQGFYWDAGQNLWTPEAIATGNSQPTPISTVEPNTSPAVVVVPGNGSTIPDNIHVYYVDMNHAIAQWYNVGDGWQDQQLGGTVAPNTSPAAAYNASNNDQYVYYNDGNGHIVEWAYTGSWVQTRLGPTGASEDAAPDSSPAVAIDSSGNRHVVYVDVGTGSRAIYELSSSGSSWSDLALGGSSGVLPSATAVASNSSPTIELDASNNQYIYWVNSSGAVASIVNASGWGTGVLGGSVAPDTSLTAIVNSTGSGQNIYYTGSDGHFAQISADNGWVVQDPLSVNVAPDTNPMAPVYPSGGTLTPFYIGADGQIHEMQWTGSVWTDQAIGGPVGVGTCKPQDTGATWQLTYYNTGQHLDFNSSGQLMAEYDRNGNSILYTYNSNGSANQITDTQGRTYTYSYPSNQTTITDNAGGRTITLNWNSANSAQLVSDIDAARNQTNYTYDGSGRLSTITDPNTVNTPGDDGTTTITYPAPPSGGIWQVDIKRPAPSTPGNYATTTYTSYQQGTPPPAGIPTCTGSPGSELGYGYTIVTRPDSNWTEYCYDTHDRVYETFDEVAQQPTLTTYDANDDVTGVVGPTNTEYGSPTLVSSSSFDACFRPTGQTTGTGANAPTYTESYAKPAATSCTATSPNDYLPSTATPPAGTKGAPTTVHYVYDGNGNLTSETDGLSSQNTLAFDYNANGTLADSWDAGRQETKYAYTYGNGSYSGVLAKTTVTPPTPQAVSTTNYDLDGRVSSSTDGNANTTSYTYDGNDNVHVETYPDGDTTTNTYDADGNLKTAVDTQSGETGTTSYSYWANNQLETETDPAAPGQSATSTSYAYNYNGDMTTLADGGGTVTYGYDQNDRVSSITQPGTSTPFTFTYDNDGRLVCTTYPNGMVSQQLYDAYNNLTSIQTANGTASCNKSSTTGTPSGTVFQDNAYTYAAGSDLAQTQTITSSGTSTAWNYYYDPLNRLLEASSGTAGTYNYSYDGDGNLLTRTTNPTTGAIQTAAYNNDNELCWVYAGSSTNPCGTAPTGSYTATYDSAGNMQTLGAAAGTTTLAYNDQEQTNSINPFAAGAQTLSYRGNGQNHPVQIGNQPSGGGAPGLEEDTLGISAQFPSSSSGSTPASSYTYYTRAPDGTLLAERGGGGSTSADDYYYVQDANGSVVALTISSDTVANTYTYDPFGTTTSSTGTAPNSFGFDGGYDAQGGLILFGTRYYDPALGMWTQPDPDAQSLVTEPTQADPYSFAGGDPINNVDVTGNIAARKVKAIAQVICAFLGGTAKACEKVTTGETHEVTELVGDVSEVGDKTIELANGYKTLQLRFSRLANGNTSVRISETYDAPEPDTGSGLLSDLQEIENIGRQIVDDCEESGICEGG